MEMLTRLEVQERLKIGRNKFYQLAKSPYFPQVRIGKKIYVPSDALEEWIKKITWG